MTTQVISFRASGDNLEWLESQRLDGESLNQTAQRICWEYRQMIEKTAQTSPDTFDKTVSTSPSTPVNNQKSFPAGNDFEDIAKEYYTQAMNQMNKAIAELRTELLGELPA